MASKRRKRSAAAPASAARGTALDLRMRVDFSGGGSVGPGKIALLEAIAREGSLSVAARHLGMSYRRAWMLLDDLNRSFAHPVVATSVGGLRGGGARVTDLGRELVAEFRALERDALALAARRLHSFCVESAPMSKRSARLVRRVARGARRK